MTDLLKTVAQTLHPNTVNNFEEDHRVLFSCQEVDGQSFILDAMIAYLLHTNEVSIQSLTAAFAKGFPPWVSDGASKETKGEAAFPLAIAAYLVGNHAEYERILAWVLEHLASADRFHGSKSGASYSLYRAYANLANGSRADRIRADLANASKYIGGTGLRHEPPLVRTLISLSKFLVGDVDRSETASRLAWFVGSTEEAFKPDAVFHALFLQDRFPEAFDAVLPPLKPG